jgi:hypothetical protein
VVLVLVCVQIGAGVLAMIGELLFMGGNPVYILEPLVRTVVTAILAGLMHRRIGALIGLMAMQVISLAGFTISAGLGALPQLSFTPTLTGLLTGVGLPAAILVLSIREWNASRGGRSLPEEIVQRSPQGASSGTGALQ